jgi:organic radical activating enzyme
MNCEILETLYVRSNGDIPCNDDAGEPIILGRVEADPGWTIDEVLRGPRFVAIRSALAAGNAPWPECERCGWLRPGEPLVDGLSERRVRKVQVEPSLLCTLRCPGCSNQLQTKSRPRPHVMPPELFERLLRSLAEGGWSVGEIEYCGQGEPLLHPKFARLLALAREIVPAASQRVITNGNADYARATGRQGIDEIIVSCDGARQASYEQYRIGGDVERALRFLRDARPVENGVTQRRIWKYILFEFNDSDEELEQAQHMAQEMGIDVLVFVLTHSCHRSVRWTEANAGDLPLLYPNVVSSVTPVHDREALGMSPVGEWKVAGLRRREVSFTVDRVAGHARHVECDGWVSAPSGIQAIDIAVDGQVLGPVRMGLRRPDVERQLPAAGPTSGFGGRVVGELPKSGTHRVELILHGPGGRRTRIRRRYRFGE